MSSVPRACSHAPRGATSNRLDDKMCIRDSFHDGLFAAVGVGFSLAEGVSLQQGLAAIDAAMARLMVPAHIQTRLGGDARSFQQSLQDQPWLILGVLVAIYLVLGILYESPLHPLTILSTLPSAGVGALLALRLANIEFSLIALLGLFLLVGRCV